MGGKAAARLDAPDARAEAGIRERPDRSAGLGALLRGVLVGGVLLLALGCGRDSTTGPTAAGLIIDAQELVTGDGGCRLRVTLRNRMGSDISGTLVYALFDGHKTGIGSAKVEPVVPDATTRFATSDLLLASADGHRLACSEIASFTIDPAKTTVPIATS